LLVSQHRTALLAMLVVRINDVSAPDRDLGLRVANKTVTFAATGEQRSGLATSLIIYMHDVAALNCATYHWDRQRVDVEYIVPLPWPILSQTALCGHAISMLIWNP
jgi:hypothetical protein